MIFWTGYFAVGVLLGWAWNRVEFARSGPRGTGASFAGFLFAWPLVVLYAVAVTVTWSHLFVENHRVAKAPGPVAPELGPAATPPDPPALTGPAAAQ
jgi:hypothetical protein